MPADLGMPGRRPSTTTAGLVAGRGAGPSGLTALLELPGVGEACDAAGQACTRLRWHEGLRRRAAEAAAESRVRGAWASARLDGAEVDQGWLRDAVRGALGPVGGLAVAGPVEQVAVAALRATLEAERLEGVLAATPVQALARLHVAAGTGLVPPEQVGRPRRADETSRELVEVGGAVAAEEVPARLELVRAVLQSRPEVPAVLVAAVAHGEIAVARPFVAANGLVARAVERAVIRSRGLDPLGVAVPEVGHAESGVAYLGALEAYASGSAAGVALWVRHVAGAVVAGAQEGERVAAAVRAGRLDP